jgi:hypothetical protein
MDALKDLPDMDTKLQTEKGEALCQKIDIFKELMWFAYPQNMAQWHVLKAAQVKDIIKQNKQGKKIASIEDFAIEIDKPNSETTFQNAMGQDSLTRFDQPKKKNKNKKRRSSNTENKNNPNKGHKNKNERKETK